MKSPATAAPAVSDGNAIFPRSFTRTYPVAVRSAGVFVFDDRGNRYLDAAGGAAVVTIGHGVQEIVERIHEQAAQLSYAHSSHFQTAVGTELADYLRCKYPGSGKTARVLFTSGGSEATETAIKMVRQYWLSRGEPNRYKIISRQQSYHGATLGALALSGNMRRREPYLPILPSSNHVSSCFCYRCSLDLEFPACELACAREIERAIVAAGEGTVAGFIFEPVVGASSGAVPAEGYLAAARNICNRYGILMIADEILTGAGRTGAYFAVEHWNVVPDLILLGKGLSSGYAPLGGVLVSEPVWRTIASGTGTLDHGFTYQAHPPSLAAGLAVQRYLDRHALVERSRKMGEYMDKRLAELQSFANVGNIRGKGLLQTIELVQDKRTKQPFPRESGFSLKLYQTLLGRGVVVYPMQGTADGVNGDHIMLAPPFVIEPAEIDLVVEEIARALTSLASAA